MKIIRHFLQDVPEASQKTFKRFYLPMTMAITATLFTIFLIYKDDIYNGRLHSLENMVMVLFAGVPLMSLVFLATEKFGLTGRKKCAISLSVLAVMIGYYFTLPDKFTTIDDFRYVTLIIFSLLGFVSFPFFLKTDRYTTRSIWLFIDLKISFSIIVGICVFGGFSLAILAIKTLFFPDWNDFYKLILSFNVLSFGTITPWVILGTLPEIDKIKDVTVNEKPFNLISKFVLIPIVIFYLIILYLYFGKVLLASELPKGMTSYLILSFCGVGIFTYSLVIEDAKNAAKSVSGIFVKFFFFLVAPLILLLWYAVWLRIDSYGITENRYLLIVFSLLLTGWTAYFIISKKKNIVYITASATLLAILISFGPWGMFETSFRSQKNRIMEILEKNELIKNGKVIKTDKELSFETRKDLSSALFYIEGRWGFQRISEILPDEKEFKGLKPSRGRFYRYASNNSDTTKLLKWMNIKFVSEWERKETESKHFSLSKNYRDSYTVEGPFDAVSNLICPIYETNAEKPQIEKAETIYKAELSKNCETLTISFNGEVMHTTDMKKIVAELVKKNPGNSYNLSVDELTVKESSEKVDLTIVISNLSGSTKDKNPDKITNINAQVYYSLKK